MHPGTRTHAEAHWQSHRGVTENHANASCSREHDARRLCEPVAMGDTACEPPQLGLQTVLAVLEPRVLSPRRYRTDTAPTRTCKHKHPFARPAVTRVQIEVKGRLDQDCKYPRARLHQFHIINSICSIK